MTPGHSHDICLFQRWLFSLDSHVSLDPSAPSSIITSSSHQATVGVGESFFVQFPSLGRELSRLPTLVPSDQGQRQCLEPENQDKIVPEKAVG